MNENASLALTASRSGLGGLPQRLVQDGVVNETGMRAALADVHELRGIVGSQQQQVTHMEEMMQRLDRRTVVLERAVVDLQNKADRAMRLLPGPDDENRTVLEKAKDVITGA